MWISLGSEMDVGFSWLSHAATQQLFQMPLAWGDPDLCHVKGCGRTFAGLAPAVADPSLPVLAQMLDSLNKIFSMGSTHC